MSPPTDAERKAGQFPVTLSTELTQAMNSREKSSYYNWNRASDAQVDSLIERLSTFGVRANEPRLWEAGWWYYHNDPVFGAIIEGGTNVMLQGDEDGRTYTIQGPETEEAERLLDITREHRMDIKQYEIITSWQVTGNSIMMKDPDSVSDIVEPVPTATLSWKDIMPTTEGLMYERDLRDHHSIVTGHQSVPGSRIIHQRHGYQTGQLWGMAPIRSVLSVVRGLHNAIEDIPVILKGFASPTRIAKVDSEKAESYGLDVVYQEDSDENKLQSYLTNMIEEWQVNRHVAMPDFIDLTTLEYKLDPTLIEMYNMLIGQLLGRFRYPRHAFLPVNNRSIADQNEHMFMQRIRADWAALSDVYNMQYIWPMARELGIKDPTKYTWKFIAPVEAEKDMDLRATKVKRLIDAQVFTPKKMAELEYGMTGKEWDDMMADQPAPMAAPSPGASGTPAGTDGDGVARNDDPNNLIEGQTDQDDPLPQGVEREDSDINMTPEDMRDFRRMKYFLLADGILKDDKPLDVDEDDE